MMNGVAASVMREAGMTEDYSVNFGVELPRLQEFAKEIQSSSKGESEGLSSLAQQLWNERVRECRILATMLYPPEQFDGDLADLWMQSVRTVELAQMAAFHLFSRMPRATDKAFQWIASDSDILQIAGYYILANILRTRPLNDRSAQELRDQAEAALASDNYSLRQAAQRTLARLES